MEFNLRRTKKEFQDWVLRIGNMNKLMGCGKSQYFSKSLLSQPSEVTELSLAKISNIKFVFLS